MSNTTKWTEKERSRALTQFAKSMDLVNEGLRTPAEVSPCLQAIIAGDPVERVYRLAEKDFVPLAQFPEFLEGNQIGLSETPNNFDILYQGLYYPQKFGRIKLQTIGSHEGLKSVHAVFPKIAKLDVFLAFCQKYLKEIRDDDKSIFTTWYSGVDQYTAFLDNTGTRLSVLKGGPETRFLEGYKLLVIE